MCRYDLDRCRGRCHRKWYTQRDAVRFATVGKDFIDRTAWNVVSILLQRNTDRYRKRSAGRHSNNTREEELINPWLLNRHLTTPRLMRDRCAGDYIIVLKQQRLVLCARLRRHIVCRQKIRCGRSAWLALRNDKVQNSILIGTTIGYRGLRARITCLDGTNCNRTCCSILPCCPSWAGGTGWASRTRCTGRTVRTGCASWTRWACRAGRTRRAVYLCTTLTFVLR